MPIETRPSLRGAHETDVAILGGGFTGLASAYFIKKRFPEKRVVVLESEFVGFGSSGRNTGISGATLGHSLHRLHKMYGTEKVAALQKLSSQSFFLAETLIAEHGIDCDYKRTGLLLVAENDKQMRRLELEAKSCDEVGAGAMWLDRDKARGHFGALDVSAGLYFSAQATLNPARFVRGMGKVVESLGVEVYEHSRCVHVTPGPVVTLYTPEAEVWARNVVVATNAYANPLGILKYRVMPFYVYNIATEPLTDEQLERMNWPGCCTVFNKKHLFWVLRLTADNRIVFIDNDALYFQNLDRDFSYRPKEYSSHYKVMTKLFPALHGIKMTHGWGGRIGITLDFLPSVGRAGKYGNVYYSLGYNGHGVAFTQLAGKMIAALMAEEQSDLTSHMLINKKKIGVPSPTATYLACNSVKMLFKLQDWLVD